MNSPRSTTRDMHRLASLYNAVALEQLRATFWAVFQRARLNEENVLEIDIVGCSRAVEEQPMFDATVSEAMEKTAVSVNNCRLVVVLNSGWLAYCSEDLDFDIEEITVFKPKPVHHVEMRCLEGPTARTMEHYHTILVFRPSSGEALVADASYAQYSFSEGIQMFPDYLNNKAHDPVHEATHFGDCVQKSSQSQDIPWIRHKREVFIRTTNNTIVEELESLHGFATLLNMSEERFQEVEARIVSAVKGKMVELRRRLDYIYYHSETYRKDLEQHLRDCDGTGHRACMQSYKRCTDRHDTSQSSSLEALEPKE